MRLRSPSQSLTLILGLDIFLVAAVIGAVERVGLGLLVEGTVVATDAGVVTGSAVVEEVGLVGVRVEGTVVVVGGTVAVGAVVVLGPCRVVVD